MIWLLLVKGNRKEKKAYTILIWVTLSSHSYCRHWCNAGMYRHHWLTQENARGGWMGVKIGYRFASIVVETLLIDSPHVIGLIIILPTQEHLTTLSLLLGLPDSTTKRNTVHLVYPTCFYSLFQYINSDISFDDYL